MIYLVHDRAAKREALQISRLAIGVGAGEDAFSLRQAAIKQVRSDKQFLRQFDHLVMAVLEDQDEFVELRALQTLNSSPETL